MDLMDYRRKIIASSPHLMSASGAVATFSDGADLPLKSLIVDIEPVQSGTGDPSPTNIRPISGWNAVKVTRDGKNLLNDVTPTVVNAYVSNQNGRPILRSSGENRTVIVQLKPNTTLYRAHPRTIATLFCLTNILWWVLRLDIQQAALCEMQTTNAHSTQQTINMPPSKLQTYIGAITQRRFLHQCLRSAQPPRRTNHTTE